MSFWTPFSHACVKCRFRSTWRRDLIGCSDNCYDAPIAYYLNIKLQSFHLFTLTRIKNARRSCSTDFLLSFEKKTRKFYECSFWCHRKISQAITLRIRFDLIWKRLCKHFNTEIGCIFSEIIYFAGQLYWIKNAQLWSLCLFGGCLYSC